MGSPRVLIGIPGRLTGAYRPFDVCVSALLEARHDVQVFHSMTGVLPGARNRIVREAIRRGAEYLWMLDDDQPFALGDLDQLLAHQVDAVIPLSVRRGAPFLPLLYETVEANGLARQYYLRDHERGLIRVGGAGLAGLLMRVSAYQEMGSDGWFTFEHPPDNYDDYAEDFPFYRRLGEAGISLYCDLETRFGHAVTSVAYAIRQHGTWVTVLADHEPFVAFPQLKHPLDGDRFGLNTSDQRTPRGKLVLA